MDAQQLSSSLYDSHRPARPPLSHSSSRHSNTQHTSTSPTAVERPAHRRSCSSASSDHNAHLTSTPPLPERPPRRTSSSSIKPISEFESPPPNRSTDSHKLTREKLRALDHFSKLGRRNKEKAKPDFPPSSWAPGVPTTEPSGSHRRRASEASADLASVERADSKPLPPPPPPSDNEGDITPTNDKRGSSEPSTPTVGSYTPPEPLTLARRIQTLLLSMPSISTPAITITTVAPEQGQDATSSPPPNVPVNLHAIEAPGSDQPSPSSPPVSFLPAALTDYRLLSLLSDGMIMNGSLEKGRQSVFAILDRLHIPGMHSAVSPDTPLSERAKESGQYSDDDSSVMLYGPLVPTDESEVEIARSDIVSVCDDGEEVLEFERPAHRVSMLVPFEEYSRRDSSHGHNGQVFGGSNDNGKDGGIRRKENRAPEEEKGKSGGKSVTERKWFEAWKDKALDKTKWKGKGKVSATEAEVESNSLPDQNQGVSPPEESEALKIEEITPPEEKVNELVQSGSSREKFTKTRVIWVPSGDKISFQATWWGYRL
ncbi:hypothetical protein HETIRDRAFT_447398 [Heterobasidion irregulare TC 32-1]|uniref:Uncharacterized protein n=1 Tax=Heterobasidion irregulare (strain TC 32-1) TaxID=747525 RepID=W4KLI9_HETIT|nr:uncharacterized protein HETIRDRAFT_447398 [Heterobasidion irregulare TC 32-1]ETW86718.1 hypothetical protein HETIRDRAFT_447398 [Heterobasidion irregulare TC 32-1]